MNPPSTLSFTTIIKRILFPAFQLDVQPITAPPDAIKLRPQTCPQHLSYTWTYYGVESSVGIACLIRTLLLTVMDGAKPFLGTFAKLRNATITSAIRPYGINRLPPDGF
jgi:hypothetical protein